MRANELRRAGVMVTAAFIWGAALGGCQAKETKAQPTAERVSASSVRINRIDHVKIDSVKERPYAVSIEFNGRITVADKDLVAVTSRISGRLDGLTVSVGDAVRRGQVIGSIWSPDLATASQEYEIARREGGELLQLTLQKLRSLGVDPSEARSGRTSFALRAPIDGVILEKRLNAGSGLSPGDIVLTVGKIGNQQFIGDLPAEQAVQIRPGMDVIFDEVKALAAVVDAVSPVSDPITHLVRIRCRLTSAIPKDVPQETFLKSRIVVRQTEALVVKAKSLIFSGDANYVFVRSSKDRNVFDRWRAEVRDRNSEEAAIEIPGLAAKAFDVVSEGAFLINDLLEDGEVE